MIACTMLLAGCGFVDEVAQDRTVVPEASPPAIASLPDDIEEASMTVVDGTFGIDELSLQEDAPTVLQVTNKDEQSYRFLIADDLVTETEIPAAATTSIEFTTPNADVYEGRLLPADGGEPIATVRVVVQSAGAIQP